MRGMARGYAAGNSRGPGWREIAGTLGQLQAGRQAGKATRGSVLPLRWMPPWVAQRTEENYGYRVLSGGQGK